MGTNCEFERRTVENDRVCEKKSVAVYEIRNLIDDKVYIGKSIDPYRRWSCHKRAAIKGDKRRLYCAIRKYGIENFVFQIVSLHENEFQAFNEEKRLVEEFQTCNPLFGYNLTTGGRGGYQMSDEVRAKMSIIQSINPSFRGKHHSEETKALLSKLLSGENNPNFGKPKTEETKEKMSKAQRGKRFSDEHKQKLRQAKLSPNNPHRGRKRPESTKQLMRDAWVVRKNNRLNLKLEELHVDSLSENHVSDNMVPWSLESR